MPEAPRPTLLLVDDEPHSLASMRMALEDEFEVLTAGGAEAALALLEEEWVQAVFCDQRMPGRSGVDFLTEVRERWPETIRIIITGYTDAEAMMEAINAAGIHQFLTKPWHPEQLLMAARNATRLFSLSRENERMALEMRFLSSTTESRVEKRRKALREGMGFETILRTPDSAMNRTVALARQYASFDVPVLLVGEPGTGRAQLARAMHFGSLRSEKPFYELNLSGLPEELALIELFGAKRGIAPGGANRIGLVQKADRGTLYLGGIEAAGPALQMQLLKLLTEGAYTPVGGQEVVGSGLRLISGALPDLAARVEDGRFRADLYYALAVGEIPLPALRERREDIAMLAQQTLADVSASHGKPVTGFDAEALEFLERYDWPGNLRELTNEVTRMMIFAQDRVLGADLISRPILQAASAAGRVDPVTEAVMIGRGPLKERVERIEMCILRETLTRCRWNKSRAAAELGLSRVGLRAKIDRYGIGDPAERTTEKESI